MADRRLMTCLSPVFGAIFTHGLVNKMLFRLFLILLLAFLCAPIVLGQPKTAIDFIKRGDERKAAGDIEGAVADYTNAIEIDAGFATPYLERGEFRARAQKYTEAIADFTSAIEIDATLYRAYAGRGHCFGAAGKYAESIADATKAIEIDAGRPQAYYSRGLAYYSLRNHLAAIPDLSRAIELGMTTAVAYYHRGMARDGADDWLGGIMDTTKAIELDPNNPKYYSGRAVARRSYGDYTGAISDYDKVLEFEPGNRYMILGRAWSKLFNNDASGAHQDALQFIEINGFVEGDGPFAVAIGYIGLRKNGKSEAAAELIERALKSQKPGVWGMEVLRFLAGQMNESKLLELAKDDQMHTTDAHAFIGVKSLLDGDRKNAEKHFKWDKEHGSHTRIAHQLARTEFVRM